MSEYGAGRTGQKTYARFLEFQEQDYCSCQPAFIQNYAHLRWTLLFTPLDYWGAFYFDDIGDTNFDVNNNTDRAKIGSARSTSVSDNNGYSSAPSGTNRYYCQEVYLQQAVRLKIVIRTALFGAESVFSEILLFLHRL